MLSYTIPPYLLFPFLQCFNMIMVILCPAGIPFCPCVLACPPPFGCSHLPCLPGAWLECTTNRCVCCFDHSSSNLPRQDFCLLQVEFMKIHSGTYHYNCPIRFKSALVTDKRVRIMNEVISGIRVIKMYAWENAFNKLISKLRRYTTFTHYGTSCVLVLCQS